MINIAEKPDTDNVRFTYAPSLDGIRAFAVILVICLHAQTIYPTLEQSFYSGFLGVDIFFVLSGFLITSILLKEYDANGSLSARNFFARRFLRLMPAYWLHLLVIFLFSKQLFWPRVADQVSKSENFLYAFFYLTNYHRIWNGSSAPGVLGHTWSLAIEEQFYIFWFPILFLMLRNLRKKGVFIVTLSLIILLTTFRALRYDGDQTVNYLYNAFDTRVDSLLIGCLFSMIVLWKVFSDEFFSSRYFNLLVLCAFVGIAAVFYQAESYSAAFLWTWGLTLFSVSVGIVIVWLVKLEQHTIKTILERPYIVWTGKVSYGLYLWHFSAIYLADRFALTKPGKFVAALFLTFSVAALSYYALERPLLKLKRHFR